MADKADDVKDDAILAALKDDGEQDTTKDPSPKEKEAETKDKPEEKQPDKKTEVAKEEKPEKEEPTEEKKEEPEAKAEEEPEKSEEKPLGKAEERKQQLNTEIRDLVSKRNALKAEVEKANAEVYQPATEKELEGQPKDPDDPESPVYTALEARVEAMRQQQEMDKYNTQVAEAQLTISHESEKVLNDFPIFNPESEEYNEEVAQEAANMLRQSLVLDENSGQVIGSNLPVYNYYQTIARAHQSSVAQGQIKGREDTEQMLANADTPGNAAPIKKEKDPVLDILKSDEY